MDQQTQATNQNSQSLSKKERYFLRRQQKETELRHQLRNKKIKKILILLLSVLAIAGVTTFFIVRSSSQPSSSQNQFGVPKMEINPKEYDLGNISMAAGPVKKTFEIKNSGDRSLVIGSIWTSCHCTTARLQIGERKSPEFGMDKRATNQKIASGETGLLEVTFDPAFHGPQGIGQVTRTVYLLTNDSQNKQSEILLNANVTP